MSHGLFDQLRLDNGRKFYLSLAIQESDRRQHQAITCYQQGESKRVSFEHGYYVNLIAKPWRKKFISNFVDWLTNDLIDDRSNPQNLENLENHNFLVRNPDYKWLQYKLQLIINKFS